MPVTGTNPIRPRRQPRLTTPRRAHSKECV